MAIAAGTITKIVVTNVTDLEIDEDPADIGFDGVVYVLDPGNTPYPGLAIIVGTGPDTTMAAILGASDSDRHTLALTGELP